MTGAINPPFFNPATRLTRSRVVRLPGFCALHRCPYPSHPPRHACLRGFSPIPLRTPHAPLRRIRGTCSVFLRVQPKRVSARLKHIRLVSSSQWACICLPRTVCMCTSKCLELHHILYLRFTPAATMSGGYTSGCFITRYPAVNTIVITSYNATTSETLLPPRRAFTTRNRKSSL